ncbi:1-acyl-sn-glycerol-3-phosphate acyltransferase [Micromonospora rhizosphaerae]|uniref:1-acyl-sn-glycerol-3-phosphate acyltransferase n=1 Tax=Micromonospora rhizosphaerae TaxID=568872 RepID=A0A1C6R9Y2_9ACTN|nr:1-acyl-sn-glycerol-3-phosphate acyltransferase [Micromonospora rhizosphaerae]
MTPAEERRNGAAVNGRYDVPLTAGEGNAEPVRSNGRRRTTATDRPRRTGPAAHDEPDTAATDEPVVGANGRPGTPDAATPDDATPGDATSGDSGVVASSGPAVPDRRDHWDHRVAGALAFLRRRLSGDYEVDEFGFDRDLTDAVFHPLVRLLYRDWFRTEVSGLENVPADGPGLVVGNHSGTVALDALILSAALHDQHPAHRYLRLLGADLVFRMPVVSEIARKTGGTVACNPDAERLLGNGELVGVFPEGFKGVGKLYSDRYKLQRFGRGGFVSAALRTGTPIVPVAIVGGEEIYPMLADIKPLARLLKLPYFPVTPTFPWLGPLGMVPLPSKWLIEFCPPIPTAHLTDSADDPMVVFNLADQVRETIQQTLHKLLERRPDPFGP